MDCFFVQVEQVLNPALRGRPVAVHQHQDVIAVSYEARALGVKKHMTPDQAKAISNGAAVLVPLRTENSSKVCYRAYREASERILNVATGYLKDFSGIRIEKASIDEFFVDVSEAASAHLSVDAPLSGTIMSSLSPEAQSEWMQLLNDQSQKKAESLFCAAELYAPGVSLSKCRDESNLCFSSRCVAARRRVPEGRLGDWAGSSREDPFCNGFHGVCRSCVEQVAR